jgi:hypothetical protein
VESGTIRYKICGGIKYFVFSKKKKIQNKKPFISNLQGLRGEITFKGARGTKVKVLFQGLHMTRVILCSF